MAIASEYSAEGCGGRVFEYDYESDNDNHVQENVCSQTDINQSTEHNCSMNSDELATYGNSTSTTVSSSGCGSPHGSLHGSTSLGGGIDGMLGEATQESKCTSSSIQEDELRSRQEDSFLGTNDDGFIANSVGGIAARVNGSMEAAMLIAAVAKRKNRKKRLMELKRENSWRYDAVQRKDRKRSIAGSIVTATEGIAAETNLKERMHGEVGVTSEYKFVDYHSRPRNRKRSAIGKSGAKVSTPENRILQAVYDEDPTWLRFQESQDDDANDEKKSSHIEVIPIDELVARATTKRKNCLSEPSWLQLSNERKCDQHEVSDECAIDNFIAEKRMAIDELVASSRKKQKEDVVQVESDDDADLAGASWWQLSNPKDDSDQDENDEVENIEKSIGKIEVENDEDENDDIDSCAGGSVAKSEINTEATTKQEDYDTSAVATSDSSPPVNDNIKVKKTTKKKKNGSGYGGRIGLNDLIAAAAAERQERIAKLGYDATSVVTAPASLPSSRFDKEKGEGNISSVEATATEMTTICKAEDDPAVEATLDSLPSKDDTNEENHAEENSEPITSHSIADMVAGAASERNVRVLEKIKKAREESLKKQQEEGFTDRPSTLAILMNEQEKRKHDKENHRRTFLSVADEAATYGRLVRLREDVVEAQGSMKQQKDTHNTWSGPKLRTDDRRSTALRAIQEAAAMGRIKRLKADTVSSHPDDNWLLDRSEHFDVDNQIDENGKKKCRTNFLLDRHVKRIAKGKRERMWADSDAIGDRDDKIAKYKSFDDVVLPTDSLPTYDRILGKRLNAKKNKAFSSAADLAMFAMQFTERKKEENDENEETVEQEGNESPAMTTKRLRVLESISNAVAASAWERQNRLQRPGAGLRVTRKCMCPYCKDPTPYQTHKYKRMMYPERFVENPDQNTYCKEVNEPQAISDAPVTTTNPETNITASPAVKKKMKIRIVRRRKKKGALSDPSEALVSPTGRRRVINGTSLTPDQVDSLTEQLQRQGASGMTTDELVQIANALRSYSSTNALSSPMEKAEKSPSLNHRVLSSPLLSSPQLRQRKKSNSPNKRTNMATTDLLDIATNMKMKRSPSIDLIAASKAMQQSNREFSLNNITSLPFQGTTADYLQTARTESKGTPVSGAETLSTPPAVSQEVPAGELPIDENSPMSSSEQQEVTEVQDTTIDDKSSAPLAFSAVPAAEDIMNDNSQVPPTSQEAQVVQETTASTPIAVSLDLPPVQDTKVNDSSTPRAVSQEASAVQDLKGDDLSTLISAATTSDILPSCGTPETSERNARSAPVSKNRETSCVSLSPKRKKRFNAAFPHYVSPRIPKGSYLTDANTLSPSNPSITSSSLRRGRKPPLAASPITPSNRTPKTPKSAKMSLRARLRKLTTRSSSPSGIHSLPFSDNGSQGDNDSKSTKSSRRGGKRSNTPRPLKSQSLPNQDSQDESNTNPSPDLVHNLISPCPPSEPMQISEEKEWDNIEKEWDNLMQTPMPIVPSPKSTMPDDSLKNMVQDPIQIPKSPKKPASSRPKQKVRSLQDSKSPKRTTRPKLKSQSLQNPKSLKRADSVPHNIMQEPLQSIQTPLSPKRTTSTRPKQRSKSLQKSLRRSESVPHIVMEDPTLSIRTTKSPKRKISARPKQSNLILQRRADSVPRDIMKETTQSIQTPKSPKRKTSTRPKARRAESVPRDILKDTAQSIQTPKSPKRKTSTRPRQKSKNLIRSESVPHIVMEDAVQSIQPPKSPRRIKSTRPKQKNRSLQHPKNLRRAESVPRDILKEPAKSIQIPNSPKGTTAAHPKRSLKTSKSPKRANSTRPASYSAPKIVPLNDNHEVQQKSNIVKPQLKFSKRVPTRTRSLPIGGQRRTPPSRTRSLQDHLLRRIQLDISSSQKEILRGIDRGQEEVSNELSVKASQRPPQSPSARLKSLSLLRLRKQPHQEVSNRKLDSKDRSVQPSPKSVSKPPVLDDLLSKHLPFGESVTSVTYADEGTASIQNSVDHSCGRSAHSMGSSELTTSQRSYSSDGVRIAKSVGHDGEVQVTRGGRKETMIQNTQHLDAKIDAEQCRLDTPASAPQGPVKAPRRSRSLDRIGIFRFKKEKENIQSKNMKKSKSRNWLKKSA